MLKDDYYEPNRSRSNSDDKHKMDAIIPAHVMPEGKLFTRFCWIVYRPELILKTF